MHHRHCLAFDCTDHFQVEDLKGILDESSDEDLDSPSPTMETMATPSQHGFIFNITSSANDLHSLHPPPKHIQEYWRLFVEHCDPLMKMLHIPSAQEQIMAAVYNPGKAPKSIEVLLFAIYYAAVTSLSSEECLALAGESQDILAKRFRYGLEQALVRAHFLVTEEIVVLQAFIIFLVCLRRFEDPRVIWSLCGVACRIAITLGLHCDGSHLGISPLETEIRRRTWWQILILDIRSSEDHGSDPVIIQHSFDTRFPLNIEDEDLTPSMDEPPPERVGITRMSFCLVRYHSAKTFARLFARPAAFLSPTGSWPESTMQQKQRWIQVCQETLQEKFYRHCDMQNPLHWITFTVSKLILAKQWLILYQPFQRCNMGATLPPETRERLFLISLDSVESSVQLEKERKTVKWGWLFKTYTQFHALAFILSDLTRRTQGPLVERAWRAVNATREVFWDTDSDTKKGPLMKPLRKLESTARAARVRALALERQSAAQQQQHDTAQPSEALGSSEYTNINLLDGLKVEMEDPSINGQNNEGFPSNHEGLQSIFNDPAFSRAAVTGNFYSSSIPSSMPAAHFPAPQAMHWQDMNSGPAAGPNAVPMGDWFTDPSFGAVRNAGGGAGIYDLGQQQQHNQQQQQQQQQHPHHQHPHSQQEQKFASADPMVGGSTEVQEMCWEDWDEMFDTVMQGQGVGPPGQWQRGPLMGETWL